MTYYCSYLEACELRPLIQVVYVYGDRKEYVGVLDLQKPILKAIGVDKSCSFAECFFRLRSNEREEELRNGK